MKSLAESMTEALTSPLNRGELVANPPGNPREIDSPPSTGHRHSPQDKEALTNAMSRVCALQKQYGKTAAELEVLVEGFSWALEGYSIEEILAALKTYILAHNDIPAPADLMRIIDPPVPELDTTTYIALKKRSEQGAYVTREERGFMRAYEAQEVAKAANHPEYERFVLRGREDRPGVLTIGSPEWRAKEETREQETLANLERWRREVEETLPAKLPEPPESLTLDERIRRTVEAMREGGADGRDIDLFLGMASAACSPNN